MTGKPKVMFLCSHNSCRSQMGEALLKKHAEDKFEIHSSGLHPDTIHPFTLKVLEEAGLDTSALRSEAASDYLTKINLKYVIIVCSKADSECPSTWMGVNHRIFWPFDDPASFEGSEEETLNKFREVRDAIEKKIMEWLEEIDD